MILILPGIALVAVSGFAAYLRPKGSRLGPWFATIGVGLGNLLLLPPAFAALSARSPHLLWSAAGLSLRVTSLSAFFLLITGVIALLASVYAQSYLRPYQEQGSDIRFNHLLLNLLVAAMLLIPLAGDVFSFLFVWEIMGLTSFLLVIYDHRQTESLRAGLKYLVAMHVGFLFLLIGFILAAGAAGSTSFSEIAGYYRTRPPGSLAVSLLLCLGFGMKAGFVPFHFWLPEAHPAAPSHVSALMSGVMIKTGIYGLLLTFGLIPLDSVLFAACFLGVAALSGLYGVIYALAQHDLKKLLAYHSVENIGIIGLGLGLGLLGQALGRPELAYLGYLGALLHVAGHAIFKSLLFFAAGSVYHAAHTREIEALGGLVKLLPWTAGGFLAGSLAICGLPPLNGFVSEFLIYGAFFTGIKTAGVSTALLCLGGALALALIGGLALACFAKAYGAVFLGEPRQPLPPAKGEPLPMIVVMSILAGFTLVIGVFPASFLHILRGPAGAAAGSTPPAFVAALASLGGRITLISLCLLGVVLALALFRSLLLRRRAVAAVPTWGCGYDRINPRMQYTASSFADGILGLCGGLIKRERHLAGPQGLFPTGGELKTHSKDLFDAYVLKPLRQALTAAAKGFRWIQHGDLQNYLLYGLVFLLMIVLAALRG